MEIMAYVWLFSQGKLLEGTLLDYTMNSFEVLEA